VVFKEIKNAWFSLLKPFEPFLDFLTNAVNFVLLNLIFFLVVFPISVFSKLFKGSFFAKGEKGYWENSPKENPEKPY
jgi:hypothetical protein